MTTARERIMGLVAVVVIIVFGGAILGYQFFVRPLQQKEILAQTLKDDVKREKDSLLDIENGIPRLKQMKKLSLPANMDFARLKYSEELDHMLHDAEFPVGYVVPKQLEKPISGPTAKKPPFVRLQYDITAQGEEVNLVDFLDRFYRTPLLHRIRTLSVVRPIASTTPGRVRQNLLDITMSIEALIVDGAEDRKTLFSEGVKAPQRLARSSAQYATIAGRDIFFGPPLPAIPTGPPETKEEYNPVEHIRLDAITHDSTGDTADLYDALNNRKYLIHRDPDGKIKVTAYYYIKDKKKFLDSGKELAIQDEAGEPLLSYNVARIDFLDLYLEAEDHFYRLHVGYNLSDVKELKESEVKSLGLPVKDKKPPEAKKPLEKKPETGKPVKDAGK